MTIAGKIENDVGINRNREEKISERKFKTNRPQKSVGTGRTDSDRYAKSESDRVGEERGHDKARSGNVFVVNIVIRANTINVHKERTRPMYVRGYKDTTPTAFILTTTSLLDHPYNYHRIKESCEMQCSISQSIIKKSACALLCPIVFPSSKL